MKCFNETLQNLLYFMHVRFSFRATVYFPHKYALVHVDINQGIFMRGKSKAA